MASSKKTIAVATILLLTVFTAGAIILNRYIQHEVEEKIHSAVPGETIDFSSVNVSILQSFININKPHLTFKKQPATISAGEIEIKGIHFWRWLTKKEMKIDSVVVKQGNVSMRTDLYQYNVSNINASGDSESYRLTIDTIRMQPLYSKENFSRKIGHQADRIELTATGFALNDINIPALLKHTLTAKDLSIKNINAYIFRDRRLPREPDLQPLPAGMIRKIPVPVRLASAKLLNGTLTYEEYPKDGDHSGMLKVEHAKISMTPFISHPSGADPAVLSLRSEGSMMGSGRIFTSMSIPLRSDHYYVKGAIRDLDLTRLNSASENLGRIHIESGQLDSLGFEFKFDEKKSTGKIIGIYHHLIIEPLKKNKKPAKLKSFLLRHVVIPLNKDRSLAERKRTGKIDYTRDPTRKFSFYLLQSLLTGIKSSFKLGFLLPK